MPPTCTITFLITHRISSIIEALFSPLLINYYDKLKNVECKISRECFILVLYIKEVIIIKEKSYNKIKRMKVNLDFKLIKKRDIVQS